MHKKQTQQHHSDFSIYPKKRMFFYVFEHIGVYIHFQPLTEILHINKQLLHNLFFHNIKKSSM